MTTLILSITGTVLGMGILALLSLIGRMLWLMGSLTKGVETLETGQAKLEGKVDALIEGQSEIKAAIAGIAARPDAAVSQTTSAGARP